MKIPKEMQPIYDEIAELIISFSNEHLNEEYQQLCLRALEKLCRKRPSPLKNGRRNTWAAGIVYAVGSNNFIFDKSQDIHMSSKELAAAFSVAASTAASKAGKKKKMLKIDYFNAEWCLPSEIGENTMLWMVSIDGFIYDARMLPEYLQVICYEKGLIPYVPAHKDQD